MQLTKAELEAVMADADDQHFIAKDGHDGDYETMGPSITLPELREILTRHLAPEAEENDIKHSGKWADSIEWKDGRSLIKR